MYREKSQTDAENNDYPLLDLFAKKGQNDETTTISISLPVHEGSIIEPSTNTAVIEARWLSLFEEPAFVRDLPWPFLAALHCQQQINDYPNEPINLTI